MTEDLYVRSSELTNNTHSCCLQFPQPFPTWNGISSLPFGSFKQPLPLLESFRKER
jgi:hypothetical protein